MMSEQPKKRRGRRVMVAAIVLLLAYALSSGPTQLLSVTCGPPTLVDDGLGNVGVSFDLDYAPWWQTAYAPLVWAVQQSWGDALCWYWSLFPFEPARPTE
jgi:hypothetical protein